MSCLGKSTDKKERREQALCRSVEKHLRRLGTVMTKALSQERVWKNPKKTRKPRWLELVNLGNAPRTARSSQLDAHLCTGHLTPCRRPEDQTQKESLSTSAQEERV